MTAGLYEDHYLPVAAGCPIFMAMEQKDKRAMVKKAQLCDCCLDNKDIVKPGSQHFKCPVLQGKKTYTCSDKNCNKSFLLCNNPGHVKLNQKRIDSEKAKWQKRGKTFAFFSIFSSVNKKRKKEKPKSIPKEKESEPCLDISPEVAIEELRETTNGADIVDVPQGEPLFLFSSVVGKTRSLNCFYDKGCSHIVLRDSVPQKELESRRTRKGPFTMEVAGKLTVEVMDEWLCVIDRTDGRKQAVQGVTVERITSEFPKVDLREAVVELKASDPANAELQGLKVPYTAGGEADILFGMQYHSCHPVIVHTLPCGLFIAKLQLATPDNRFTAAIGGPHTSFAALSSQAGDVSRLMIHFVDGLKSFRELGAPKLVAPLVTQEDIDFAHSMNFADLKSGAPIDVHLEDIQDPLVENPEDKEICDVCEEQGCKYSSNFVEVDLEDNLKDLKAFEKAQESGLSISYRLMSFLQ